MFISSASYKTEVQALIARHPRLRLAVAFWGRGSDELITGEPNSRFQIICNLTSGGTNPDPIRALTKTKNVEIRTLSTLHAKVICGDNEAIVGSANLSTNGLNNESDENPGWEEAGIKTDVAAECALIDSWFLAQWEKAKSVTEIDLELAQIQWNARRSARPMISEDKGLFSQPVSALRDRPVYLAFYEEDASSQAETEFADVVKSQREHIPKGLDFFEGADHFPLNASIISIYYGKRGAIHIDGPYLRIPQLDRPLRGADGGSSTLNIVVKQSKVLGNTFDSLARDTLRKRIQADKDEIFLRAEKAGWIVSLYAALTNDS